MAESAETRGASEASPQRLKCSYALFPLLKPLEVTKAPVSQVSALVIQAAVACHSGLMRPAWRGELSERNFRGREPNQGGPPRSQCFLRSACYNNETLLQTTNELQQEPRRAGLGGAILDKSKLNHFNFRKCPDFGNCA